MHPDRVVTLSAPGHGNLAEVMSRSQNRPDGLTIGLDARAATEVEAGRGRVVRELLRGLGGRADANHYVCYARRRWDEPLDDRFAWRLTSARDPLWHARVSRDAGRVCDVFLATNSYLTVILNRIPTVGIVYDLVVFEPGMAPNRRSAVIERLTLRGAVGRANELVCISRATADALVRRYPDAAGKVTVAPLAVAPVLATPAPDELDELPLPGFVLAVGTLEPRKNLPRLVAAYSALPDDLQRAHPLVVVGAAGWQTGATLAALRSLGERCVMLGHVSDAALAELYRRCRAFCYPSLGEGFGLPVLEAMAAGAAVITSNISSLPEVGGDAVEYVDPRDTSAIGAALETLLRSTARREELRRRGLSRAQEFSWDRFTAAVLAALERAAGADRSAAR